MKYPVLICLLLISRAYCQQLTITPEGRQLKDTYLAMNVERLWLAGSHVNWETGLPDEPSAKYGVRTHCSAFVAAACQKLGIYILKPQHHKQVLLANAQADWLNTADARQQGWKKLPVSDSGSYIHIQQLANNGKVIVAVSKNPDPEKPGHAALVMPGNVSEALVKAEGPEMIMAGTHNYNKIALLKGFRSHIETWPSQEVEFFVYEAGRQL